MLNADWKKRLEEMITTNWPGVKVRWKNDNPTIIIPKKLKNKTDEIKSGVRAIFKFWHEDIEF